MGLIDLVEIGQGYWGKLKDFGLVWDEWQSEWFRNEKETFKTSYLLASRYVIKQLGQSMKSKA